MPAHSAETCQNLRSTVLRTSAFYSADSAAQQCAIVTCVGFTFRSLYDTEDWHAHTLFSGTHGRMKFNLFHRAAQCWQGFTRFHINRTVLHAGPDWWQQESCLSALGFRAPAGSWGLWVHRWRLTGARERPEVDVPVRLAHVTLHGRTITQPLPKPLSRRTGDIRVLRASLPLQQRAQGSAQPRLSCGNHQVAAVLPTTTVRRNGRSGTLYLNKTRV